jgi:Fe-S-cluster containining protein
MHPETPSIQERATVERLPPNFDMLAVMRLPEGDSELVQIMDAALADAARRAGAWLACRPGCTQCCHGAFAISPLDALRLDAGMKTLRRENPALAAEIERRAHAWLDEHRAGFPGDTETGLLGGSDADQERFEEFANEAACPALDPATGCCDVYPWRPMTCRVFGPPVRMNSGAENAEGLGHCELCFIGATPEQVAACEMPVPHELEAKLLEEVQSSGETVVAFALLRGEVAHSR